MFKTKTTLNVEETIKELRTPSENIEINFQNECKDSPILSILLIKFHEKYIMNLNLNSDADLSPLGKKSDEYFVKFEKCPGVSYFSYTVVKTDPKFQVSVRINDQKDSIQNLGKITQVAELLDKVDPEFVLFITKIIDIETQYRRDTTIAERFNDLIPEKSIFKSKYEEWIKLKEACQKEEMKAYRHEVDGIFYKPRRSKQDISLPACFGRIDNILLSDDISMSVEEVLAATRKELR